MRIQNILAPEEKVLWTGKPVLLRFIASYFSLHALALLLFAAVVAGLLIMTAVTENIPASQKMEILSTVALGTGFLVSVVLGAVTHVVLTCLAMEYAITDKRVMLRSGIIGKDFTSLEHHSVTGVAVFVGLLDKLFGTGTVTVYSSGRTGGQVSSDMVALKNPYEVYQALNKISHDIRTDINYPNALRPAENRGYDTAYMGSVK